MANKEMHIHVGDYCFFFYYCYFYPLESQIYFKSQVKGGIFKSISFNSHISPMR